jgi:tRNA(Ile)-lysidine synthase
MLKEYIRFQNMKNIDVVEKLKATVSRFGLLEKGDRVLVALSGGPDSVALLHGLLNLKPEFHLELYVAHLNHKLRGVESDEDEKFAKKLASDLKLKFFSKKVDVRREAKKRKLSIEETAREVRYRYLERLADRVGANKIALGHQADDQAETFLMRLVRGAGAAGLSGMPVRRDKIIRPLIQIKREEIERFLKTDQIPFRLDSSNYLTDFNRNKIRLKLLPVIKKEFNPRIVDSLNRAADIISLQQGYVQKISEQILKKIGKKRKGRIVIDAKKFARYDTCLRREMIRLCINDLGGDISQLSFELVDRTLNLTVKRRSGKRIKLDKSVWFEVGGSELVLFREEEKDYIYSIKLPGKSVLKDRNLMIESKLQNGKSSREFLSAHNQKVSFLDWEKLVPPFVVRNRREGDRFKPLGMKGTKSIADFLIDAKVPRHWREDVPVLTSKGRIVWLVGHRISDEFKVTGKTKKVLRLEATTIDSKNH